MDVYTSSPLSIDWEQLCKFNLKRSSVENIVESCGTAILFRFDRWGYFPIHWATITNKADVIEYMLECGVPVDITVKNQEGTQCIHLAAQEGYPDVIDILIMHEAQVNAKDNSGCTPLMRAAFFGYNDEIKGSETVLHLLSRGANPFEIDKSGMNALHFATLRNNEETVHLLLTIGLNANIANRNGLKPLHFAYHNGNSNLMKTLKPLTNGVKVKDLKDFHHRKSLRETLDDAFTLVAKIFIVVCCIGAITWAYPQYAFYYYPRTRHYLILHTILIISSTLIWVFWYRTIFTDPGYLPKNTPDYQHKLQTRLGLASKMRGVKWLPSDPYKGVQLCHICKLVQPRRSKHCRFCNRCTACYDHHCVYLNACVGERNRLSFFGLISNMFITGFVFSLIILITALQEGWHHSTYHLSNFSYCFKLISVGGILTVTTIRRAAINLTQNEEIRATRYRYLRGKNGKFHNPFDKGVVKNLLSYFKLRCSPCRERIII